MTVLAINHINIRSPDYQAILHFLREALGMRIAPVQGHESTEKGAWAYDETGNPVLHLASADVRYSPDEVLPDEPPQGSGVIHHLALTCDDFDGMRARLTQLAIPIRENHRPETGMRQIFVHSPGSILFELNFSYNVEAG